MIYLGNRPTYLKRAGGIFVPYNPEGVRLPTTTKGDGNAVVLAAIEKSKNRKNPIPWTSSGTGISMEEIGEKKALEASFLVMDATPLAELEVDDKQRLNDSRRKETTPLFPFLAQGPLIRCLEGEKDNDDADSKKIAAIASGVRSCLVSETGSNRWFRLKGCGNNEEGFLIKPVLQDDGQVRPNHFQLRGCAYRHTALTELFMTERIGRILEKELLSFVEKGAGSASPFMSCANTPVGWYEYDNVFDERNINTHWPQVTRCCVVFESLGDRRLSDHLLAGLEMLLSEVVDASQTDLIHFSLPDGPFGPRGAAAEEERGGVDEMSETWMVLTCGGFLDCPLEMFANVVIQAPTIRFENLPTTAPRCVPSSLHSRWEETVQRLKDKMQSSTEQVSFGQLFAFLYSRLGLECGSVVHALHKHGISWGTYRDLSGTHCNAHGNNFVIRPPTDEHCSILAPLDFDMAFDRSCCWGSEEECTEWFATEEIGLLLDLGGSKMSSGTAQRHSVPHHVQRLRTALRDTMVVAALQAIKGETSIGASHLWTKSSHSMSYDLVELALMMTVNVIA